MECGMSVCKKCATMNLVFGILFLLAAFWKSAPTWFNGWSLVGLYLLLWGLFSLGGAKH